jgi:single-stranded-DNA-specific exonuclease
MWTSRTGRRWAVRASDSGTTEAIRASLRLSPLTSRILAARGYDAFTARQFLSPGLAHLLDPGLLKGLPVAIGRIDRALTSGEQLRLVTDYDVDGTTSCLILHAALDRRIQALQSKSIVSYHIPDRFKEGYGLSCQAVEQAKKDGISLLITADIGVRDHSSIRRARELGVDVLVCDHHLPPGEDVPEDACAVICPPQKGCRYPNKALAACGVSLKLASALLQGDPRRNDLLGSMLKLAAIGTVADVVDLSTPENRAIVALGMERLSNSSHAPGLKALLEVADLRAGQQISTHDIGYRIAPRINAAGRLKDANAVIRLIRERDPYAAAAQASQLDALNRERQGIQSALVDRVLAGLQEPYPDFVVASGQEEEGWHRGVVGIVAAKVRDRVRRPAAVLAVLGDYATGSVRSIPMIHAVSALDSVAPLLKRYGGHAAAAGFTLETANIPAFTAGVNAWTRAAVDGESTVPDEEADAMFPGTALKNNVELAEELAIFEPAGKGNPRPRLVVTGEITGTRTIKEKHLGFNIGGLEAIWWNEAERLSLLQGAGMAMGSLEVNQWAGNRGVRLVVEDVA